MCLPLDVRAVIREGGVHPGFGRHPGLEVAGELACGEHKVSDPDGFGVIRQRLRRAGFDRLGLEPLPGNVTDEVDLDQGVFHQKTRRADRGPRGRGLEILLPNLVKRIEKVEVGQKHLGFDNVVQGRAGGLKGHFEVPENIIGLPLDFRPVIRKRRIQCGFGRNARLVVAGELPGGEDEIAHLETLRVIGERGGCVGRNDFRFHEPHSRKMGHPLSAGEPFALFFPINLFLR